MQLCVLLWLAAAFSLGMHFFRAGCAHLQPAALKAAFCPCPLLFAGDCSGPSGGAISPSQGLKSEDEAPKLWQINLEDLLGR